MELPLERVCKIPLNAFCVEKKNYKSKCLLPFLLKYTSEVFAHIKWNFSANT